MKASGSLRSWRWLRLLFEQQREALLALGALLVFALMLTLVQYARLDQRLREDLQVQADMVADTASAALLFDNAGDAAEILSAFKSSDAVDQAVLLDTANGVLASYARPPRPRHRLDTLAGQVQVVAPVRAKQDTVGRLVVRASRLGVWLDLLNFVGTALGMLFAALGLAWLASHRLRADVREAERRTRYLAHHDALTDLPNRETLRLALASAAAEAAQNGTPAALLFIDLDNFKQINDNHGHAAGDRVLQAVAQRLRGLLRPDDLVARLAGDEFAMLLAAPVDEALARDVASRVVQLLPQLVDEEGDWLRVHVSVGLALLPAHALDPDEAMQCADAAMYQAKRLGKDGYQLYSLELGESLRARLGLEQDLREALAARQLSLAYQPIFDREGRLVSMEALARWRHARCGWVSPAEFIPLAEASGLIVELGLNAIERLAADLRDWHSQGLVCPPVALNLSSRQCRRPRDRERLLEALARHGLGPQTVEFELTESSVFEDLDQPDSMVALLQSQGYALAIDDFGTGYSSLAYLRRMRCRKLKIDRLFIHGLANSTEGHMLVESVIRVAQAMQMLVVAEGVEERADWQCLVDMGCDLFQGFGLSRPLAPVQLAGLLHSQQQGQRTLIEA
ncbi:putative bifunctional diguanylate cyclase/phosphodiesterase [Roseateles microcysteis]|uniref:putative bifunctional diguanylate cyclase/phosphodiesterase n=1 Tax=Roseateles microcysteis TaxID=3119057 RepID=UPI002FE58F6E